MLSWDVSNGVRYNVLIIQNKAYTHRHTVCERLHQEYVSKGLRKETNA